MTFCITFPAEPQIMDNSIDSIRVSAQENGQHQVSMKINVSNWIYYNVYKAIGSPHPHHPSRKQPWYSSL